MATASEKKYKMLLEEFDRLMLEAKSPEELERILKYKLKGLGIDIPEKTFRAVFDADKTKKKSFATWMLQKYGKERATIESMVKNGEVADFFRYFQERSGSGLSLSDFNSVEDAVSYLPKEKKTLPDILKKDGDKDENDFEILYQSPEWIVARPFTFEADKKLGAGCRWCTAAGFDSQDDDDNSYFEEYTGYGPLFINFDLRKGEEGKDGREYPFKRYQFCFEYTDGSKHGEFCNLLDKPISLSEIGMPEDVIKFYGSLDEEYEKQIRHIKPSREEYLKERLSNSILLNSRGESELRLMVKLNDDFVNDWSAPWGVFDSHDNFTREVNYDTEEFSPYGVGIVYVGGQDYPIVLLKDIDDILHAFYYLDFAAQWKESYGNAYKYGYVKNGSYFFVAEPEGILIWKEHDDKKIPAMPTSERYVVDKIINRFQDFSKYFSDAEEIFEIIFTCGYHTLIKTGQWQYADTIISKDIPLNGEVYSVSEDGFIHGKFSKYKVAEGGKTVESDYTVEEVIPRTNNSYAIVKINNQKGFNILDCNSGNLLLKENQHFIELLDNAFPAGHVKLYANETRSFFVYDCINKKIIYNDALVMFEKYFDGIYHGVKLNSKDVLFLENEKGECVYTGKIYDGVHPYFGYYLISLRRGEKIEILDARSRKISLSVNGARGTRIEGEFLFVEQIESNSDGDATLKTKIIDIKSGKILADDVAYLYSHCYPVQNGFYCYETNDGYNLLSVKTGKVLEDGCKRMLLYKNSWCIAYSEDKFRFIPLDGSPIYPLKELSTKYVSFESELGAFYIKTVNGKLAPINHIVARENGDNVIYFEINPSDWTFKFWGNVKYTEQEQKLVASVMNGQNNTLEEQFKDTFRRIINFKYD